MRLKPPEGLRFGWMAQQKFGLLTRIFIIQAEQVRGGIATLVIHAPNVFMSGRGDFSRILGNFDGWNPTRIFSHGDQFVDSIQG